MCISQSLLDVVSFNLIAEYLGFLTVLCGSVCIALLPLLFLLLTSLGYPCSGKVRSGSAPGPGTTGTREEISMREPRPQPYYKALELRCLHSSSIYARVPPREREQNRVTRKSEMENPWSNSETHRQEDTWIPRLGTLGR